ncbi:purine nucleoside permease [Lasius niger]|uniref:Purine nucleoside permease n=1 Tax=Lasius niger TaxID=67767 RepID=A0A0J7KLW3_LASNI|nr:purine nucleoside permease [Lasius niger]
MMRYFSSLASTSLGLLFLTGTAFSAPARQEETLSPKVIVVAGWENGKDTGDAPGEYQFWVERLHLDQKVTIHGVKTQVLRRNKDGVYGIVLKDGIFDLSALALDPKFDLKKTYWIFTGISGIDPKQAAVGSVAWARWVVDGDALREIDDRKIPKSWPYGLWAIGADKPNTLPQDPNHYGSVTDVAELSKAYPLNPTLTDWAYQISQKAKLSILKLSDKDKAEWKNYPEATKAPKIMLGETLGALRYWHGEERTQWARDWVKLWTNQKGRFVMTNEESQTNQIEMRRLDKQELIDLQRVMVLRSGSNFCLPPQGIPAEISMGNEGDGQVVAFDNNERAGEPVIKELLKHWDKYQNSIPSLAPKK